MRRINPSRSALVVLPLSASLLLGAFCDRGLDHAASAQAVARTELPDDAFPNEPAGFERVAEHGFDSEEFERSAVAGEWALRTPRKFLLRKGQSALSAPSGIWEFTFDKGMKAGRSPVRFDGWSSLETETAPRYDELYVSTRVRLLGRTFENQKVGTKLWYVGYGNTRQANDAFLMLEGNHRATSVESAMRLGMYVSPYDDREGGSKLIKQNRDQTPRFTVGEWHHVEVLLATGDVDRANGVVRIWVDGVKVTDRADVKFLDSDFDFVQGFFDWQWTPVWGGMGGVRSRQDTMQIDHVYISGRRAR